MLNERDDDPGAPMRPYDGPPLAVEHIVCNEAHHDAGERAAIEAEPTTAPLELAAGALEAGNEDAARAELDVLDAALDARANSPEVRERREARTLEKRRAELAAAGQALRAAGERATIGAVRAAVTAARATLDGDRPPPLAAVCRALAERPTPERLAMGLPTLDAACQGGIPAGGRVVLLGAPGAGKTALAVQCAHTWALAGARVAYLAMDQRPEAMLVRVGEREGLARDDLEGVSGPEAKRAAWHVLADRLEATPQFGVLDGADTTLEDAAAALRAMPGDGPRVLVADSLQTVRCARAEPADNPRARMDVILDVLREVSAEGILVLAVSEMARGGYVAGDRSPVGALAAAKESGAIEYWADVIVALRSVAGEADEVDAEVPKNRLGERPELRLRIDRRRATLTETDRPVPASKKCAQRGPEALERRILDVTREQEIRTMRELCKAVGVKWKTTTDRANAMLERGALRQVGGRFRPAPMIREQPEETGEAERVATLPALPSDGNVDAPSSVAALPAPVGGGNGNGNAMAGENAKRAIRAVLAGGNRPAIAILRGRGRLTMKREHGEPSGVGQSSQAVAGERTDRR